jgi:hypothetical protein
MAVLVRLPESALVDESVFPVIISPWFSTLIHRMGDEKYARWWPQFRDGLTPIDVFMMININKILSVYQPCQFVEKYRYRDNLSPTGGQG